MAKLPHYQADAISASSDKIKAKPIIWQPNNPVLAKQTVAWMKQTLTPILSDGIKQTMPSETPKIFKEHKRNGRTYRLFN